MSSSLTAPAKKKPTRPGGFLFAVRDSKTRTGRGSEWSPGGAPEPRTERARRRVFESYCPYQNLFLDTSARLSAISENYADAEKLVYNLKPRIISCMIINKIEVIDDCRNRYSIYFCFQIKENNE